MEDSQYTTDGTVAASGYINNAVDWMQHAQKTLDDPNLDEYGQTSALLAIASAVLAVAPTIANAHLELEKLRKVIEELRSGRENAQLVVRDSVDKERQRVLLLIGALRYEDSLITSRVLSELKEGIRSGKVPE